CHRVQDRRLAPWNICRSAPVVMANAGPFPMPAGQEAPATALSARANAVAADGTTVPIALIDPTGPLVRIGRRSARANTGPFAQSATIECEALAMPARHVPPITV